MTTIDKTLKVLARKLNTVFCLVSFFTVSNFDVPFSTIPVYISSSVSNCSGTQHLFAVACLHTQSANAINRNFTMVSNLWLASVGPNVFFKKIELF